MQEMVTQKQFFDAYEKRQRVFENACMQFFDIFQQKFSDIVIKDSKLAFCNFNNCEFQNIKFENCTFYFVNFYTGTASGFLAENCDIEQMLFDNFQFDSTEFRKCSIRWSGILNSNSSSVNLSTSSQHKLFTDISQVTAKDVEEAVHLIMRDIERLDVSTRLKIKGMIRQDIDRYSLKGGDEKKGVYEQGRRDADAPLTYGEVKGLVESTFGSYGKQEVYKTEKPYKEESKYR